MGTHTIPTEELATLARVTEEEYLRSNYRPDCDYIDGRVEERNVGEYEHSGVQGAVFGIFWNHAAEWGVKARPECRLQAPELTVEGTAIRLNLVEVFAVLDED